MRYVSNCFSLPVPWQKYREVCFVKNWQDFWNEAHKTVDDLTWVLLVLLRLGAVHAGPVVCLLPLKDSNPSTASSELSAPLSQNILYLPIFELFRESVLPPGLTPLIYKSWCFFQLTAHLSFLALTEKWLLDSVYGRPEKEQPSEQFMKPVVVCVSFSKQILKTAASLFLFCFLNFTRFT